MVTAQVIGDKDLSELSMPELSRMLDGELRTLKVMEGKNDRDGVAHSLGNMGAIYLGIAKKLNQSDEATEQVANSKRANLGRSIEFLNRSAVISEEVGDIDQLKASYKNLSVAQKMTGNVKGAVATYKKMLTLKKTIFTAKKTNEIEKNQLEYLSSRREDSIRKANDEHVKEQQRILAQKQKQLDSANKTLTVTEHEKQSVSKALVKTQADLTMEKLNAQEKAKKLTLIEQERTLQSTSMKLAESKLELQQSELQLQKNKQLLLQDELASKDRVLGIQRTYMIIGFTTVAVLACFLFFITRERKKAIQQKLRAERSEQFKQDFIANISHEIRTPMNAINGMTALLLHKNPRPEQENYLKAINKSADILLHVINDVLDLSKIEAGKVELETIDFSISDTIAQVRDTLAYRAEDKGLQLITRIDENVDDVIVGDPFRLNQVLINLGGNALKFTDRGGVYLDVDLVAKENENVFVRYSISDTGIGIPADKLSKLFVSFSQVNSSDTRKYGGTGLGLAISKDLVELQGGTIAVESIVGSGTTFSFIIKYPVGSATRLQQRITAEQNSDGAILNGLRILIADDNEYNRLVVDETLHIMADVFTEQALNGQEAVDMLKKNDYDLVLMDVQMPVMNGMDATRYIREHLPPPKNKIPIIALTASVLRADLDLCFQSGMTAYVPKPFKAWQLVNTIAEVTGRQRTTVTSHKERSIAQTIVKETIQHENSGEVTNLGYLTKFCEGDGKRMTKYIKIYLNALPAFHKNVRAAIANKDFTELALHVHSFKPKWMMMGMKEINELGIKIDQMCKAQNEKAFEDVTILLQGVDKSLKELEAKSINLQSELA
jgi:signal transduction histidine kinase/DNA-binding NarL/FixJ family response regulator